DVIERRRLLQIDKAEQMTLRDALNAVLAMSERRLQIDEIEELRQRQRDHREVDALAADRDEAGHHAERGRGGGADQDAEFGRQAPDLQRMRAAIARGAQKHRVPEREQAAIADQEIERA